MNPPPSHVLAAFGIPDAAPQVLAEGPGHVWRAGDVVLKPTGDAVEAAWTAATLEGLDVPGLRPVRPICSSDGRWVVGGWVAQRYVPGRPEPRVAQILEVAALVHRSLAALPRPRFLDHRNDLLSRADRLAWGDADRDLTDLGVGHGREALARLAAGRRPVDLTHQVVHADLYGTVLFDADDVPAIVSITPFWRPAIWAEAVVVVDAVSWGGADAELIEHGSEYPEWLQVVRRALMFRLAVSLTHPRTTSESLVNVLSAVEVLQQHLD